VFKSTWSDRMPTYLSPQLSEAMVEELIKGKPMINRQVFGCLVDV